MQNAAPLKYGVLPPELEKFRELNRDKDKYEQLAKILLLGRHVDAEDLLPAVNLANQTGSPTFDTIRFYLEARNVKMTSQDKTVTEGVDIAVDKPEFSNYDTLYIKGVDCGE